MSILQHRRADNDLGHPLCDNLRNGNWLMDYTAGRLLAYPSTTAVRLCVVFVGEMFSVKEKTYFIAMHVTLDASVQGGPN